MPMNKPRVIIPGIGKQEPVGAVKPNARKRIEMNDELKVTMPATFYIRLSKAVSAAVVHLEHCPKPDNPIFAEALQKDIQELKEASLKLEEIRNWADGKDLLTAPC